MYIDMFMCSSSFHSCFDCSCFSLLYLTTLGRIFFAEDVKDVTRNDSTRIKHEWLTLNTSTFQLHVRSNSRQADVQSHASAHFVSQKCPLCLAEVRATLSISSSSSTRSLESFVTVPPLHTSLHCVLRESERWSRRGNLVLKFVSHAPHTPSSSTKKRIGFLNPCWRSFLWRLIGSRLGRSTCVVLECTPLVTKYNFFEYGPMSA